MVGFVSAANIMYSVFDDGNLPECVVDNLLGSEAGGYYEDSVISVYPYTQNPIGIILHETGHFLSDKVFVNDKELEELISFLYNTDAIEKLKKRLIDGLDYEYLLDRDEIWAIAFTQYTLIKVNLW